MFHLFVRDYFYVIFDVETTEVFITRTFLTITDRPCLCWMSPVVVED